MNRRIVLLTLLLAGCIFPAAAQQRLKPAPGVFSELGENYMHSLRKTLIEDRLPILSIVVGPSFSKEYALSLYRKNQANSTEYTLTYSTIDDKASLWTLGNFASTDADDTSLAPSKSNSVTLSESDAKVLDRLFKAAIQTMQMPDLNMFLGGCDGTTYYISYEYYTGTCWSPGVTTNCGRLVNIAEQLIEYIRQKKSVFPANIRQEIAKLTHDFKSLRTADDFTPMKSVGKNWQSGDEDSQTILTLNFPDFHVSTSIPPSVPTQEAFELLSQYEPVLREIARRIYMLEEFPYIIILEVVDDKKAESAEIRKDDDLYLPRMDIKLRRDHLSADMFMRIYEHLAASVPTEGKYMLDKEQIQHLIKEIAVQKQN